MAQDLDKWIKIVSEKGDEIVYQLGKRSKSAPLQELTEAVDDPDYDPTIDKPRHQQQAEAHLQQARKNMERLIEAGELERVDVPVIGIPLEDETAKNFKFSVQIVRSKKKETADDHDDEE